MSTALLATLLLAAVAVDLRSRRIPNTLVLAGFALSRARVCVVMDADGSHPVNLTNNAAPDYGGSWSPDGRRIAFSTERGGGDQEVAVMNRDGSGFLLLTNNSAKDFPGEGYDLVCIFDALHDMGDPVGASAKIRSSLKPDGTWLLVEPFANDELSDNLNPIGRLFYSASTMICTPASLSQEVGLGLGAQAGERRLKDVVSKAGFTRFRRATETPFNLVFEVRP